MAIPPPTDLDRLASAWQAFLDLINSRLPSFTGRAMAVRSRVSTTPPPPGPRPL